MPEQISSHRLGAYIYGFLSGMGLVMVIWGLASISMLPSTYLMLNIGIILFGVSLFACGSSREAYLRGNLSSLPEANIPAKRNRSVRPATADIISEQIIGTPEELTLQESHES
jgi:hypothetical protein